MTDTTITAKQILTGIRQKYRAAAVVREVVIDDPFEQAILNRWQLNGSSARYYRRSIEKFGAPVANAVPAGWSPATAKLSRRIDALIIDGSHLTAVEIKVTRADFRKDTDSKRRAWRNVTHRFVYAAPAGLLLPDEIPDGCGLWEYDPAQFNPRRPRQHGMSVVKNAVRNRNPEPLPRQVFVALAYRVSKYETAAEKPGARLPSGGADA